VPEGTYLFREQEEVDWYYLIDSGEVLFQRDGREVVLGPGSFVGEFGPSFDLSRHHSSARALTDLETYRIGAEEMRSFISSYPGTYVRMAKSLSDTLKQQGRPVIGA